MRSRKALLALTLAGSALVSGNAVAARLAGSTDTIAMVRLNGKTGDPVFGEQVTFRISTSLSRPFVRNDCSRNGVLVSSEVHEFTPDSYFGTTFTLGPTSLWRSGAADCTARLLDQSRKRARTLATTTYHVRA